MLAYQLSKNELAKYVFYTNQVYILVMVSVFPNFLWAKADILHNLNHKVYHHKKVSEIVLYMYWNLTMC